MDSKISKYFCIFCENCTNFETISDAYNHYKNHMSCVYYCPDCDNQRKCTESHPKNDESFESEQGLIEMWIERFLAYQSEFIDKTYSDLFRSTKLFSGCAVCESFLRLCTNNDIEYRKGDIHWSANQSTANESRHACSHLRYYPFECFHCERTGKYHKKCDFSEITRHIRNSHSMSAKNPNFESLIKSVKIQKLEALIEYSFKNRCQPTSQSPNKKTPSTPSSAPPPTTSIATNSVPQVRSSRRITHSPKRFTSPVPVVSEPKPKRPKMEAQMIVINNNNNKNNQNSAKLTQSPTKPKNTTICSDKNDVILNLRKPIAHQKQQIISNQRTIIQSNNNGVNRMIASKAKVEIKFKPIVKTGSNPVVNTQSFRPKQNNLISGDQIIIKKVSEPSKGGPKPISLINKTALKITTKPVIHTIQDMSLSQQFSDMMDDEEGNSLQFDPIPDRIIQNVNYFCIFCPQKCSDKEEAYKHLQKHVDYYPIICLTCGEGLTDCQSFMKHHRESHPAAVKGKYKKKEQPIIDKWISSFLYSQATIIRSFPPRECCPVCDMIFARQDVLKNKPRRCTINRKIDHLYRHLSYLPYECILCRETGQEFLVAYFESKAHSHIKLKHPEIDDTEERWQVFQKTISVPKLDEYIENYLTGFGISMQLERRPVKKALKYGSSPEPFRTSSSNAMSLDDSSLNLNMIFSDIMENPNESTNNQKVGIKIEDDMNAMDGQSFNEYNNNSNDNNNIVVNVSPQSLFDKSTSDDMEEPEEETYFCIFCPQSQEFTKMDAYSHYGQHLDYNPVLCKICEQSYSDVDHLMAHHQSAHTTQDNVDYEIREDQVLVKWVNEFLESQKSIKKVMPCSCSYNCPVCIKLIGSELSDISMPCTQHNDVIFSVHIHKHLNYFPYECLTCKRNNRSVRVPNLDSMAMNHLKEHNIINASMTQVVRNFPKTLVISQLEKLIGDSVHRKRISEKKSRPDMNQYNCLPQTILTKTNIQLKPISIPKSEPSSSRSPPNKTQHIRLEGGRVVNLPQRSLRFVANTSAVETNGANTPRICNICCVHCRKLFPNKRLFKSHHNQSHPGKPILCSKSIS